MRQIYVIDLDILGTTDKLLVYSFIYITFRCLKISAVIPIFQVATVERVQIFRSEMAGSEGLAPSLEILEISLLNYLQ